MIYLSLLTLYLNVILLTTNMEAKTYKLILNKLNRYAKSLGLDTVYTDSYAYAPTEGLIMLNEKDKGASKLILYYLHELGHAIQEDSYFHKLKYKTLNIKRSIILEQEYTAWVNGTHIATDLKIMNYIINEYLEEWVSAWQEYAEWLYKSDSKTINNSFKGYVAEGRPPLG